MVWQLCVALLVVTASPTLLTGVIAQESTPSLPETTMPTTTTTTTVPLCTPISLLSTLQNATAITPDTCNEAQDGQTCSFQCNAGFVPTIPLEFNCSVGIWFQADNLDIAQASCVDFDACFAQTSDPCNTRVSRCVDNPAPSTGFQCECLYNHVGLPGADGSGCSRVTVGTDDGDIVLVTGASQDIRFVMGSQHYTAADLSSAITDETQRADDAEASLETAQVSASSSLADVIASLEAATSMDASSLESVLRSALMSRADSLASSLTTTSTSLASAISSNDMDIASAATAIGGNARGVASNEARITTVNGQAVARSSSLASALATASDSLEAVDGVLSQQLGNAVMSLEVARAQYSTSVSMVIAQVSNAVAQVSSNTVANYYTKSQANSRYYTKSQVDSLIASLRSYSDTTFATKAAVSATYATIATLGSYHTAAYVNANFYTRSYINSNYYTAATSNSRYYTQAQSDGRYYTKSELNGRMVHPINSGAVRRFPVIASDWIGDDDGGYVRVYDSAQAMQSNNYRAEWYQWVDVPPYWYLYKYALYSNTSGPNLYIYARQAARSSSGWIGSLASTGSINRELVCSSCSRYSSPTYQFIVYLTSISTNYVYGGYYEIRRT